MYYFILLLLSATGILFQSCSVSQHKAQKHLIKAEAKKYDVIIVPGIPLEGNKWGNVMRARVLWAKYLYDNGIADNIIFSGSSVYTPFVESIVMKLYAVQLGVPANCIFTEKLAEHSTENIYYSYKLARNLNFSKIALATDPFQSKMLKKFIKSKVDRNVDIIPFVYDTLLTVDTLKNDPVIDFSSAFVDEFSPITERESFWKRFKGTMGKSIDMDAYN